jgi:hypothetical protein
VFDCPSHAVGQLIDRHPGERRDQVGASILTAVWHMLSSGVGYADLGTDYLSRLAASKTIQRLLKRLADVGWHPQPTSSS